MLVVQGALTHDRKHMRNIFERVECVDAKRTWARGWDSDIVAVKGGGGGGGGVDWMECGL